MHRFLFPERSSLPSFHLRNIILRPNSGPPPPRWEKEAGKERLRAASLEMVGNIASSLRGSPRRGMAHNCSAAFRDAHLRPCRATFSPDTLLSTGKSSRSPAKTPLLPPSNQRKKPFLPLRPLTGKNCFEIFETERERGGEGKGKGWGEKWRTDKIFAAGEMKIIRPAMS